MTDFVPRCPCGRHDGPPPVISEAAMARAAAILRHPGSYLTNAMTDATDVNRLPPVAPVIGLVGVHSSSTRVDREVLSAAAADEREPTGPASASPTSRSVVFLGDRCDDERQGEASSSVATGCSDPLGHPVATSQQEAAGSSPAAS